MLLKIRKMTPRVMKHWEVSTSRWWIHKGVSTTLSIWYQDQNWLTKKNYGVAWYSSNGRLHSVFITEESRLPGIFDTSKCFCKPTPQWWILGASKPNGEYTREKMANMNNFRDICQNSKSFLGMSNGTKRSCLMKKKEMKNLMILSL